MAAQADLESSRPLQDIKVLDLSRILAGPWCTQILGDLGADVIKVERPSGAGHQGGDDTRGWGPPFLKDDAGLDTAEAAYYLGANRNKRSITVDLASQRGQALIRQMASQADVLVENYKVGDMLRYGLDSDRLRAQNPRLVYCSITGYGQTGPYKDRAGYDFAIQGLGGLMSVTGASEQDAGSGQPGGGPQKAGVAVADLFTGMYAVTAILAALRHRDQTGQGQTIDMALLDSQVAMLANLGANYLVTGVAPRRAGNAHQNIVPYQVFEASDGHLILAVGNDHQFRKFCAVAACEDLAIDPRFRTNADRVRHRDALVPLLAGHIKTRSRKAWLADLEAAQVPCGPINDLAEVFADPQVKARGMTVGLKHPFRDTVQLVASPIRLSATPVSYRRAPPLLGQHTVEVLREFGVDEAEIERMRQDQIV